MHRSLVSALAVVIVLLSAPAAWAKATTQVFSDKGPVVQSFVVPTGVTELDVRLVGGRGGRAGGGAGAVVTGRLFVTPGMTLQVRVGGDGDGAAGGFNGGGDGGRGAQSFGGGGGGASDIRTADGLATRIAVAAGGGGAGGLGYGDVSGPPGGDGGAAGAPGAAGGIGAGPLWASSFGRPGGAATANAGGPAGAGGGGIGADFAGGPAGAPGALGLGGASFSTGNGGGGGGGLYGGGGGGTGGYDESNSQHAGGGGGGGGSSLAPPGGTIGLASIDTAPVVEISYGRPTLTVAPGGGVTFGSAAAGTLGATRTVTITNDSAVSAALGQVRVVGTAASDFLVVGATCPGVLAPRSSCTLDVVFAPTATGARTAALQVTSTTAPDVLSVPFTGTGLPASAPPAPASSADPASSGGTVTQVVTVPAASTASAASQPPATAILRCATPPRRCRVEALAPAGVAVAVEVRRGRTRVHTGAVLGTGRQQRLTIPAAKIRVQGRYTVRVRFIGTAGTRTLTLGAFRVRARG